MDWLVGPTQQGPTNSSSEGERPMSMNLEELEKSIERKISELEREKGRLKEDLRVVRQASAIAAEFGEDSGQEQWREREEEPYEESYTQ